MRSLVHPRTIFLLLFFAVSGFPKLRAGVVISEFVAQNITGAIDEDGEHEDWIELYNDGASSVSLNGWYLTDDATNLQKWRFPLTTPVVNLAPGGRLVVWCSNKNRKAAANRLHTNFKLDAAGEYLGLIRSDGFTIEHSYGPTYPPQFTNSAYGVGNVTTATDLVAETANGKAKIAASATDFTNNFAGWNNVSFNDSAWQSGASGFGYDITNPPTNLVGPLIGAGGVVPMAGVNTSCFLRFPFTVPSASNVVSLALKMKYADGYVAFLNGTQIAARLNPGTVAWNSAATSDRTDSQATVAETASLLSNAQNLLVTGNNILAIQMLTRTSSDFFALVRPQLTGNVVTGTQVGYLTAATPNAANSTVKTDFGPAISQVTDQPPRPVGGAGSAPILITAKVVSTLRPLATTDPVVMKYRVMYGTETSLVMVDNGTNGDVTAGDGIYSAQMPTTGLAAGQMIRWRIEAKDNTNIYSYEPPYPSFSPTNPPGNPPSVSDATDTDQYFGTVALDPAHASSLLPVLHWFVRSTDVANTRSSTGASCSLYFIDRFYDNVRVELHGQSSAGFPVDKKSHNVNFTKTNRFKWQNGTERVRSLNLLTNYADKTKVRNALAWEAWQTSGHLMSHWHLNVRVQQNGVFWGVYDMVEDGNEDFLERYGYNGFDALYKIYDDMSSTGGAEQKTREDVDSSKADYQALLNGLVTSNAINTRRLYAYDNVDVGAIVNALAVHALINNNDWGHKNYYLFRNTTGSGEWSILPWDQDLSSGHTWTASPNGQYFNDEIDSQRTIPNGPNNRLKRLVSDAPELNKMFVRRMRTLMDEVFVSGTSTTGWYETRVPQILDQLDPPPAVIGAGVKSDQQLDFEKWGFWVHLSSTAISHTDSRAVNHTIRAQASRLLNPFTSSSSSPFQPYPGYSSSPSSGFGNTTHAFTTGRRRYLYNLDGQNPGSGSDPIPSAQPAVPSGITIEAVDYNPGNADQEYFIIKNASGAWVDVSGWKITGAGGGTVDVVDYTFLGGTVIPNFTGTSLHTDSGDVHAGRLHVVRKPAAFRARSVSPKGGEYRQVVGPYNGRLSARGGTIELRNKANQIVATTTWAGNPTASQNFLRVTELNFDPAPPTAAELAIVPGLTASDFEFIELVNTGASSLTLTGAQFDKGITFTFPTFTLNAGQRCLVVANQLAFQTRYGTGFNIAGEFEGSFDNSGETVRLLDAVGEEVLEFTYDASWYPPTDGGGYSLVTRISNPTFDGYDNPTAWAISGNTGGSPGSSDSSFSQAFEGWRHDFFTLLEQQNPALAAAASDAENDGKTNLYEYAFGGNPRNSDGPLGITPQIVNVGGTNYPAVQFNRRKKAVDLTYVVEVNSDLANAAGWTAVNLPVGSPVDLGNGLEQVVYRDSAAASANTKRMFRVRAVKP
jgi:hypothetical protein